MLRKLHRCLFFLLVALSSFATFTDCNAEDSSAAADVFSERILPILRSKNSSSCTECHFSGVELSDYIVEDQAATFAALRSAGLIDVQNPDKSKILTFISRKPKTSTPELRTLRAREHQAFRSWLRAAVRDPELLKAKATVSVGTELPDEVIRHARKDRVLSSFVENIWSEVGRCVNCHSPDRNRNKIGRNGQTKEDIDAISWIVPNNPAATLENLVDSGNIDFDDPVDSQLLTKPTALVKHGGGPKFPVGSRADKNFRRFLIDYAAVINGKYKNAKQLPKPSKTVAVATGQHLRILNLPRGLDKKLLRIDIHRVSRNHPSKEVWATAEGPIAGQDRKWQGLIFATALRDSRRAKMLKPEQPIPGGRYIVKIYIDRFNKTKKNRDYELGKDEFFGQVPIQGAWKPGWREPKIIQAPSRD